MARVMHTWGVYLLECGDGSFYCGSTNQLEQRLQRHNAGRGARYTRSRLPVRLAFWRAKRTRSEALRAEALLKQWSRAQKVELVERVKRGERVVLRFR